MNEHPRSSGRMVPGQTQVQFLAGVEFFRSRIFNRGEEKEKPKRTEMRNVCCWLSLGTREQHVKPLALSHSYPNQHELNQTCRNLRHCLLSSNIIYYSKHKTSVWSSGTHFDPFIALHVQACATKEDAFLTITQCYKIKPVPQYDTQVGKNQWQSILFQ